MSNAAMLRAVQRLGVMGLAAVFGGCALFASHRFMPGVAADEVRQRLGPPTAEYALPQGARQLEYASGEFAKTTYMYVFDGQGRLVSGEQVLTEARFATITPGMGAAQVRLRIGTPSVVWPLARQQQRVWSYRYESPFCQWFMVGMGPDDTVVDTAFGEDPMCRVND